MARYRAYDLTKEIIISTKFDEQILPGTFEHTLHVLFEELLDLSYFDSIYKNDKTGAPAINPKNLLKAILFAYSRGILSSRKIEFCCKKNIVFMALTGSTKPHFTTIANFISSHHEQIIDLYTKVLLICANYNLLDHTIFALDGSKLSSNASKENSGTREDFEKKAEKLKSQISLLMKKHIDADENEIKPKIKAREEQTIKTLQGNLEKIQNWLDHHEDKIGHNGKPIKSNITDNESAKMKSSHGFIQGYNGQAMVDSKYQIVVHAEVFGVASDHNLLQPMVDETIHDYQSIELSENIFDETILLGDAGYHSEKNMEYIYENEINAYIADKDFRKRDPRFKDAGKHKERHNKELSQGKVKLFTPKDFAYNESEKTCVCPAGNSMHLKNQNFEVNGLHAVAFMARESDCRNCALKENCLRNPGKTKARQVYFFDKNSKVVKNPFTEKMKSKIDTDEGKFTYGQRLGIVEPVFADICWASGMNRFTLRGRQKVDSQWKLYCMVHNIKKIQKYGSFLPKN